MFRQERLKKLRHSEKETETFKSDLEKERLANAELAEQIDDQEKEFKELVEVNQTLSGKIMKCEKQKSQTDSLISQAKLQENTIHALEAQPSESREETHKAIDKLNEKMMTLNSDYEKVCQA